MTSPLLASVTDNELVRQIYHISLEPTDRIIQAVKKTHVPYETLQITQAKLAESEAKTEFLQDKVGALKRKIYDMMALHLQACGRQPPLPSVPPPSEPGFHKRASAERAAILALPDPSSVIYTFPLGISMSQHHHSRPCAARTIGFMDVLDTFCSILATEVRLQVGMGHTATAGSGSTGELCSVSIMGDRAEMNPLIIKLARSGFSWDSRRQFFMPLRPLGQGQSLLV